MSQNEEFSRQEQVISSAPERHALQELWESCDRLRPVTNSERAFYHVLQAWRGIRMAPVAATVTTLTISVTLFLLSALLVVYQNVSTALQGVEKSRQVSVFFMDSAGAEQVQALKKTLAEEAAIEQIGYVSKEKALERFRESLGENSSLLSGLADDNPLPESLELFFSRNPLAEKDRDRILYSLKRSPLVEHIQDNHGLVRELGMLIQKLHVGGAIAICITLIMTGFIISNTVQLALFSRRTEVEIMRLVGATDRFIRAPFLIEGAMQGIAGAVFGLVLLRVVLSSLWELLSEMELFQLTAFEISYLTPGAVIGVLAMGALVGVGGSFLAVRRFSIEAG